MSSVDRSPGGTAIDRVLLIPGLLEPRVAFLPMQRELAGSFEQVKIWRDRYVFRNLEASVGRLAEAIASEQSDSKWALVTHSFGDWVARQAIARTPNHRVDALVSIAPVMRSGVIPQMIHFMGGDLIPEIAIIADAARASACLDCDTKIRRLIIWAAIDLGVRPLNVSSIANVTQTCVAATHLSVVMQPNVLKLVHRFLIPSSTTPSVC